MDGIRSGTALKECLPSNVPPRGCQAESIEELKQLLLCTALELQSTRRVAREEMKRHEENIRQLVQHLNTICKERDEAREGCLKLQEKLLQASLSDLHSNIVNIQPDSPAARSLKGESSITECDSISDTCKHHSLVSSPVNSMFEAVSSMEEPFKLNLASSDGMDFFQQPYLELSEQCQRTSFPAQKIQPGYLPLGCGNSRYQNIDIQEHIQLQCESKRELSNPSRICHSSRLLEESSFFQSNPILNVSAPPFTECNLSAEHQTSMQPVCTSSAHTPKSNVQHGENILEVQEHMSEQSQEQQSDKHSKLDKDLVPSEYIQSVLPGCEAKKDNQSHNGKLCSHKITERDTLWHVPESIVDDYQMASSCSPSSVLHPPSITNHGIAKLPSRSPSPPGGTEISSNLIQSKKISDPSPNVVVPPVSVHLPEPPEADPQVIMNSLPEKGKLLQAVMKAGPLLQTLLLAGSLPQWQQPPPALNSCEIPLVSMPSIPTPVHPVLNPPQLNSPVHDNVNLMHKSPSSFCSQNQSGISQIPPATLLPPSAKTTNLSSNKRPLFIHPVNGEAVQDTKPSHKYAKLQQHVDPTALN